MTRARIVAAFVVFATPAFAADWTPVSPMIRPRLYHTATTLPGDQILVTGGCVTETNDGYCAFRTAETEIFDLGMLGFKQGPTMSQVRAKHTATALPSGDVIVIGGCSTKTTYNQSLTVHEGCPTAPNDADFYDATQKTMTAVQPGLVERRWAHAATLLVGGSQNGKVLVTGGFDDPQVVTFPDGGIQKFWAPAKSTAELYDPVNRSFTKTAGDMLQARGRHSATLLVTGPNAGKVLIVGGSPKADVMPTTLATSELFDPSTGQFTSGPTMATARADHTAVRLPDGRVWIYDEEVSSSEMYDPQQNSFSAGPSQSTGVHSVGLLLGSPVDQVLIAGDSPPAVLDPVLNTVRATGFVTFSFSPVIASLSAGRALLVGGQSNAINPPVKTAFLFSLVEPGGACAANTDCRLVSCIDNVCCKKGCDMPCGSCTAPAGDCIKVTGRDSTTCVGTSPEDLRTCNAQGECKKKQGVACDNADLCVTGFCSDGFCCESACTASCVACDFPRAGLCVPVAPQPVNGRAKCPAGEFCSGGGPDCVPAYCDGNHTLRRPKQPDVDCSPYRCTGAGKCFDACSSVDQCAAPSVCDSSGHCVPNNAGDGGCALANDGDDRFTAILLAVGLTAFVRRRRRS